jgi:LPXTG-site transpeptidase (sortase) family protein
MCRWHSTGSWAILNRKKLDKTGKKGYISHSLKGPEKPGKRNPNPKARLKGNSNSCYNTKTVYHMMDLYIKNQIEAARLFQTDNPIGLVLRAERHAWTVEEMLEEIAQEKWFNRFSGALRFASTFVISFVALFAIFNYQAYSKIATTWFTAMVRGEEALVEEKISNESLPYIAVKAKAGMEPTQGIGVGLSVVPPDFRIEIPGIFDGNIPVVETPEELLDKQEWIAFEGRIQDDLRKGVVHYPYTAYPGETGNVFITGHSSYYPWDSGKYKSVFALLPKIELGKTIIMHFGGKEFTYRVVKKYEVRPTEVNVLKQPQDKKMLTLMTCTPVGTTMKRLIVEADLVENTEVQDSVAGEAV